MASITIFGLLQSVYALIGETSQADPEGETTLTLAVCIKTALKNNPNLKAAQNDVTHGSAYDQYL